MLCDSILRFHFVDYFLKYHVKLKDFSFRSTEFVVQICVLNLNVIRRLEKKLWEKSMYFFNDPRIFANLLSPSLRIRRGHSFEQT